MKKENITLKCTTISPLHIGSGNHLMPNSELLDGSHNYNIIDTKFTTNNNPEYIKEHIHTAGRAFIPGSSIKGLIKNALLYDWLRKNNKGKNALKTFVQELDTVFSEDYAQRDRKKKYKILTAGTPKNQTVNPIAGLKGLENAFNNSFDWNGLRITDVSNLEANITKVYETKRLSLNINSSNGIPVFYECINKNVAFEINIQILENFQLKKEKVLSILQEYYNTLIDYEINLLEDEGNRNEYLKRHLGKFYQYIPNDENDFHFRVGAGKSIFYQTISMNIREYENEKYPKAWVNYKELLMGTTDNLEHSFFPSTRIVTNAFVPLGWVKFEVN